MPSAEAAYWNRLADGRPRRPRSRRLPPRRATKTYRTESGTRCRHKPAEGILGPLAKRTEHVSVEIQILSPKALATMSPELERDVASRKRPRHRLWGVNVVRKDDPSFPICSLLTSQSKLHATLLKAAGEVSRHMGSIPYIVYVHGTSAGHIRVLRRLGALGTDRRGRKLPRDTRQFISRFRKLLRHACGLHFSHSPIDHSVEDPRMGKSYLKPDTHPEFLPGSLPKNVGRRISKNVVKKKIRNSERKKATAEISPINSRKRDSAENRSPTEASGIKIYSRKAGRQPLGDSPVISGAENRTPSCAIPALLADPRGPSLYPTPHSP